MKKTKLSRLVIATKASIARPLPVSERSARNLNADQCRAALRKGNLTRDARAAVERRLTHLTNPYHLPFF